MFIQVPWIHARLDEFSFHPAAKRTFILGDPCVRLQGGVCVCVCVRACVCACMRVCVVCVCGVCKSLCKCVI